MTNQVDFNQNEKNQIVSVSDQIFVKQNKYVPPLTSNANLDILYTMPN